MDNLCGDVGRGRGLVNGATAVRWEGGQAKEAKAALRNPVRGEWGPAERHLKRSTSSRLGGDNLELRWTRQTCWAGFKQHCLRYVHKWPNANAQPLWMKHRETGRFALSLAFGKSEKAQKRHYQPVFPLYLPWQGQTCTHLTMPQFVMAVFIIKQKKKKEPLWCKFTCANEWYLRSSQITNSMKMLERDEKENSGMNIRKYSRFGRTLFYYTCATNYCLHFCKPSAWKMITENQYKLLQDQRRPVCIPSLN